MKVAIISSCSLPVPAVNGGAVESLIESIVKVNELQEQINITVYAIYSEKAKEVVSLYPHTKFVYLKKPGVIKAADNIITVALRKLKRKSDIASRNYIWKLVVLSELKKNLNKENYDAVVLQNTMYLFYVFRNKRLHEKYRGKVYFHVHNSLVKTTKTEYESLLCRVISISDFLHKNIRDYLGSNVNIVTVHNGIEFKIFNKSLSDDEKIELKRQYGIPEKNKVIIFVGRIAPEKGIRETISAFEQLNRQDCDLLIVGASYFGSGAVSPFESEIMAKIKNNPRIHLAGFIGKKDIWKCYALGDFAILPSMWEEPLGLTMIEAQAAGIPLITTLSGGIPETVDARYSILLERNSQIVSEMVKAMENILENSAEWKSKAKMAQIQAEQKFDESVFYNDFINVLKMGETH